MAITKVGRIFHVIPLIPSKLDHISLTYQDHVHLETIATDFHKQR